MSGVEILGLVLGGIPLAISAIEHYRECSKTVKGFWRYDSMLRQLKINLYLQQKQFERTLQNLGLFDSNLTWSEIEQHLAATYPHEIDDIMAVIEEMDKLVGKLMEDLEIDMQGKPRLTDSASGRAEWEWRRVKRSFGDAERKELIDELQRYNTALACCFERREVAPSDDLALPAKKAAFNAKKCDIIRDHARSIHDALKAGWKCLCPHPHQADLHLDWKDETPTSPFFNVVFSSQYSPTGQISSNQRVWQKTRIELEDEKHDNVAATPNTPQSAMPKILGNSQQSLTEKGKGDGLSFRFKSQKSALLSYQPAKSRHSIGNMMMKSRKKVAFDTQDAPKQSSGPTTLLLSKPPTFPLIPSLCRAIQQIDDKIMSLGFLPDSDPGRKRRVKITGISKSLSPSINSVHLKSLLQSQPLSTSLKLSRKQRFGIATAMAWAVLHLYGSPWLSESWNKEDIYLFFESQGAYQKLHTDDPYVSSKFSSTATASGPLPPGTATDQFQNNQIRNKPLFALGILLIELCLNRPFEELRRENRAASMAPGDYDIADKLTDSVYLEAGDAYGYAVQRCLRCEFPGRDVTKTLDFAEFRRHFYEGVVAPIQSSYGKDKGRSFSAQELCNSSKSTQPEYRDVKQMVQLLSTKPVV